MELDNDVQVLQAKVRTLTERLEAANATSAKLKNHLIGQAIRKNKTFQDRILDYDNVAAKLADHFQVDVSSDIPRVRAKEKVVSLMHGYTDDPNEAIGELLQTKFKDSLLPEQPAGKPPEAKGDKQSSQAKDGILAKLKAEYAAAKERGDGPAMISVKRRLAQAGFAGSVL